MKYLIGYDIGSSSVKGALLDAASGKCVANAFSPRSEMEIRAPRSGYAEQDPETWWNEVITVTNKLKEQIRFSGEDIIGIGISYQMHGLVCVDKDQKVLLPAIIWCDSRAVEIGNNAFKALDEEFCLQHLLNSPGNFTASKLRWVRENLPEIYARIHKIMLPGDFIAMKLTGDITTTISGLSEGIFWDFPNACLSDEVLEYYDISKSLIPDIVPGFGEQGRLNAAAAELLSLKSGIPVAYRAGDQPNNAYSLNVLNPGEVAATAGTSGVIYGVSDQPVFDELSRVNTFIHVNNTAAQPRNGILLCVNGTGILNSWLRKNTGGVSYEEMNRLAAGEDPGSEGLLFFPFGNGAERILENKNTGARLLNLDFNRHGQPHVFRAAQEGIVFALRYGLDIMHGMQVSAKTVKAAFANMFLSPVFREAFANTTGAIVELYNTDGAQGAARAAGVGAGFYKNYAESFTGMVKVITVEPDKNLNSAYQDAYGRWLVELEKII